MTKILITGGGTGGHVQPAMAVIAELRKRDPDIDLLYVGSANSVESKLAAEAGVPFKSVSVGKLRRSSKGLRGLLTTQNFVDALRVPVGISQAYRAVRRYQPDVVFGTGGYVSVPTIVAAGLQRIPVLTHEQTVTIGLANRIAGRYATRIAVSFEDSIQELPKKLRTRAFVTGNPIRTDVFDGFWSRASERFGFELASGGLPCVYVTGGAQGSRKINHAVRDALPELLLRCRILHQCGSADLEEMNDVAGALPDTIRGRYIVRQFVERDEIGDAYALADVVIGRAGAGTVCELAALGKPSVLIPLEPSSKDEQLRNAQRLADAGGAVIVRQASLTPETLIDAVMPMLRNPEGRVKRGLEASALATPNATNDVVDALLTLAGTMLNNANELGAGGP
jgi:UDP-N-acetylglucosamine--N-acetylmuramyl-(pentapeptide) pyrophosphoryl-undecaprenol N-acetylglucosamine transferase